MDEGDRAITLDLSHWEHPFDSDAVDVNSGAATVASSDNLDSTGTYPLSNSVSVSVTRLLTFLTKIRRRHSTRVTGQSSTARPRDMGSYRITKKARRQEAWEVSRQWQPKGT